MKENQKELDELIQEVMDQMREGRYEKKIVTRYRSSFQLLMTVTHDIGDVDLCQYFGQKKSKDYAAFLSSSSSFC